MPKYVNFFLTENVLCFLSQGDVSLFRCKKRIRKIRKRIVTKKILLISKITLILRSFCEIKESYTVMRKTFFRQDELLKRIFYCVLI